MFFQNSTEINLKLTLYMTFYEVKHIIFILIFAFCIEFTTQAQNNGEQKSSSSMAEGYQIQYKDAVYSLHAKPIRLFWKRLYRNTYFKGRYYLILQFFELPNENIKEYLDMNNIRTLYYIPNMAFIVSVPKETMTFRLRVLKTRTVSYIKPSQKIDKRLRVKPFPKWIVAENGMIDINIEYYPDIDHKIIKNELKEIGVKHIFLLKSYNKFRIRIKEKYLYDFAKLPWVMWLEPIEPPVKAKISPS